MCGYAVGEGAHLWGVGGACVVSSVRYPVATGVRVTDRNVRAPIRTGFPVNLGPVPGVGALIRGYVSTMPYATSYGVPAEVGTSVSSTTRDAMSICKFSWVVDFS